MCSFSLYTKELRLFFLFSVHHSLRAAVYAIFSNWIGARRERECDWLRYHVFNKDVSYWMDDKWLRCYRSILSNPIQSLGTLLEQCCQCGLAASFCSWTRMAYCSFRREEQWWFCDASPYHMRARTKCNATRFDSRKKQSPWLPVQQGLSSQSFQIHAIWAIDSTSKWLRNVHCCALGSVGGGKRTYPRFAWKAQLAR